MYIVVSNFWLFFFNLMICQNDKMIRQKLQTTRGVQTSYYRFFTE